MRKLILTLALFSPLAQASGSSEKECRNTISASSLGLDPCAPPSFLAQSTPQFEASADPDDKRIKGGGTGGVD